MHGAAMGILTHGNYLKRMPMHVERMIQRTYHYKNEIINLF